jgi:hypothetical protein
MKLTLPVQTPNDRRMSELAEDDYLHINGYNLQRIVYELLKNYMLGNKPEECGIQLAQKYDADPTKSGIKLEVAFTWKTQDMDKVPAIYVQRGDIDISSPLIAQATSYNVKDSEANRMLINEMPVIISCVAAEPVAVVENLAEFAKQALMSFRSEVKSDFRLRKFQLRKITKPERTKESKNNFVVDLMIETAFDEEWKVSRQDLRMKTVGLAIFDGILASCKCQD